MFEFGFQLVQNDFFEGPGLFRFDFKECHFIPKFYTYNSTKESFERILKSLKKSRLLTTGTYRWMDNYYGPIAIENIEVEDFVQFDGLKLYNEIGQLIECATTHFSDLVYQNGEKEKVNYKAQRILEFIPVDTTTFYRYNLKVQKLNLQNQKLIENNLFDYFFFIIGFNEEKFYLITLFYE